MYFKNNFITMLNENFNRRKRWEIQGKNMQVRWLVDNNEIKKYN